MINNSNQSNLITSKASEEILGSETFIKHNEHIITRSRDEESTFQMESKRAKIEDNSTLSIFNEGDNKERNKASNSKEVEDRADEFVVEDESSEFDEDDVIRVEGGIESSEESDAAVNNMLRSNSRLNKRRNALHSQISELEMRSEVRKFIQRMNDAAINDEQAYSSGKVALSKLKMIDEVCKKVLMNNWTSCFISEGLLDVLVRWLTPFHDGTLPNLSIRSKILELINNIPLKEEDITSSEIGKTMCELWKNSMETTENRQIIRTLIQRWVKLISKVKNSTSLDEVNDISSTENTRNSFIKPSKVEQSTNSILHIEPRTARIPINTGYNFKVIPGNDSNIQSNIQNTIEKPTGNLNISWNKKIRNSSKHAMKISLEGKGL